MEGLKSKKGKREREAGKKRDVSMSCTLFNGTWGFRKFSRSSLLVVLRPGLTSEFPENLSNEYWCLVSAPDILNQLVWGRAQAPAFSKRPQATTVHSWKHQSNAIPSWSRSVMVSGFHMVAKLVGDSTTCNTPRLSVSQLSVLSFIPGFPCEHYSQNTSMFFAISLYHLYNFKKKYLHQLTL